MKASTSRFDGVAISLHWIIALLIIGLLVMGKYMTGLDESDALRFTLTQWHKSFGIVVLLLILFRLTWRFRHSPPALPSHMPRWEVLAAHLTHVGLYLLMVIVPLSGWIMVSASPLDLPTLLFNRIPWPHLPPFDRLANREELSDLFVSIHDIAGLILILMLFAHIGAALRHRLVLHDTVLDRMLPKTADGRWLKGVFPVILSTAIIFSGLIAYGNSSTSAPLEAGQSRVSFTFILQGNSVTGVFAESNVELSIDNNHSAASTLRATVNTATASANNGQIDSTLRGSDWFDVGNHPTAQFESSKMSLDKENNYTVSGTMTIRGTSTDIQFPLSINEKDNRRMASGSFTLDRRDFGLGRNSQPGDNTVGFDVEVAFEFEVL